MPQNLSTRLKATQEHIGELRDQRASTVRDRDVYAAEIAQQDAIDRDGETYKRAKATSEKVKTQNAEIEAAQEQESNLLLLLASGQPDTRNGGNGPEDLGLDAGVESLKSRPGALLAAMLERRKAGLTMLSDDLRLKPQAAAGTFVSTAQISTLTESDALIDLLAPRSVALASGIAQLRITTTKARVPRFTDLPISEWIPEQGTFPKSSAGIEMVERTPPKVGLVTPLSVEVFEDLTPLTLAMLQTQMLRSVALAYDAGILFGTGANGQPRGVANTTGIGVVTGPLNNFAPFAKAIAMLVGDNAFPGALAINPLDLAALLQLVQFSGASNSNVPLWTEAIQRSADGTFAMRLPYFQVPVWPTPAAPQGTALMYDPATIIAVIRREADIALDPFYGFDTGEVGLRTYIRGDVVTGQPKGAIRITLTPPAP